MSTSALIPIVGLTGGIASGKSTVSEMFRDLGVRVIDADVIAREVVAPGSPALDEIRAAFGEEVIDADGALDRMALGQIVFQDAAARRRLEQITHPRIAQEMMQRALEAADEGHRWIIYDAALIVENGLHHGLFGLIVVAAEEKTQIQRIIARDHLGEHEARQRIEAQMPLAQKLAVADWIIDNNGTLEQTRRQVEEVHRTIEARLAEN